MMGDHFGGDMSGHAISGQLWTTLDAEDDWTDPAVLAKAKAQADSQGGKVAMIYLESPANPTNALVDVEAVRDARDAALGSDCPIAIDNTFLGPLWSRPLDHGADITVYSLTKYVGGHSDLIAGGIVGNDLILTKQGGGTVNAGNVRGPAGPTGAAGSDLAVVSSRQVLDTGITNQIRAGRQLTAADFTAMGLSAPIALYNLGSVSDSSGNGRNQIGRAHV